MEKWMGKASFVVWVIVTLQYSPTGTDANAEGAALYEFKKKLVDPKNALQSWDNSLDNPCTWDHITCNPANEVTRVDLGNSGLSGQLVKQLGDLPKLQSLELYKNKLTGPIPPELGNLVNLVTLDLYNNKLSGPIPKTFGKLSKLQYLRLQNNYLSGRVPVHELAPIIPHLKVVDISGNPGLCTKFTYPPC